jgi:hypothetical protein
MNIKWHTRFLFMGLKLWPANSPRAKLFIACAFSTKKKSDCSVLYLYYMVRFQVLSAFRWMSQRFIGICLAGGHVRSPQPAAARCNVLLFHDSGTRVRVTTKRNNTARLWIEKVQCYGAGTLGGNYNVQNTVQGLKEFYIICTVHFVISVS